LACQAALNGVFDHDRHAEGLTEKLRSGDSGRGREAIRATREHTIVGEDETLTLAVKPEGLLGAQTAIAHSGCRGRESNLHGVAPAGFWFPYARPRITTVEDRSLHIRGVIQRRIRGQ
jgi:hypothetical protein